MLTGLCTRSTTQWHAFSSFTLSLSSSYALMSIVLVPSRSRILEATSSPWRCQACSLRAGRAPSRLAASALCRPYQSRSSKHILALFQRSGIHLEQVASSLHRSYRHSGRVGGGRVNGKRGVSPCAQESRRQRGRRHCQQGRHVSHQSYKCGSRIVPVAGRPAGQRRDGQKAGDAKAGG